MSEVAADGKLKTIGLIVGVIAVFGYVVKTAFFSGGDDSALPTLSSVAPATGAPPVAAVTQTAGATPEKGVIVVPALSATAVSDPFRKVVFDASPVAVVTVSQPPPMETVPLAWPEEPGTVPVLPSPSDIAATMVLKGMISGQRPVAVIQVGAVTYIVKRGEPVGEDLVVERIGVNEVTLRQVQSGKTVTLKF